MERHGECGPDPAQVEQATPNGAWEACRARPVVMAALAVLAGAALGGWLEGELENPAGHVSADVATLVGIAVPAFALGLWIRAAGLR
ncbi:MAG: hypothetical protein HUU28_16925, partial [Planctomycetaceae bacterium]|nr:hypothetical protein [Planctomycetaceae bacterium]